MAILSMQLDPNAVAYTDDEIVGKVNTAAVNITRAGSVEAAARPIAAGEVGATELENEAFLAAEKTKLTSVETDAAADQTGAEIKTAYEAETGAFNPTKDTKLTGIEAGAKDDQSGAEIKTAYEAEANAYTDTKDTKLTGIDANAKDDQTGAEIKTAYEGELNTYNDTKDTKLDGIAAGAEVNPADLAALDSVAATKLGGVEENAKDDQTGEEVRDLVVALAPTDRKIIVTDPATGEHKVIAVQRLAAGDLDVDYDDVPES